MTGRERPANRRSLGNQPFLPLDAAVEVIPEAPGQPPSPGSWGPGGQGLFPKAHPFLKWAGGKRRLLPELTAQVQRLGTFGTYHEPFLGGGALFFELWNQGRIRNGVFLSDVNDHLMEVYRAVATDVEEVIRHLRAHQRQHSRDHYYATRGSTPGTLAERAARLLYLNRTCFNGLFRENRSGVFNVPMGRYRNPRICDESALRAASKALASARLQTRSFEGVLKEARPGDLVYFDPPYVPLSKTASFTAYAAGGFTASDQSRLAEVFGELATRGVHAMLSNSETDPIPDLYSRFRIHRVLAVRAVNSRADRRGPVPEVLVTTF